MHVMKELLSSVLILAFFAAVATAQNAKPAPDRKEVYKTVGDIKLNLNFFLPKDFKAGEKRPCVVFFHGGGWEGGTPDQFFPHCRHLADRGMVAISAEYRIKSKHGTTPVECVSDAKSAIRYVRQNAAELGVDPERIAAGGGSAGGQMAAATSTSKSFDEKAEDLSVSSRPNALVLFNPVFDNGPGGWGHGQVSKCWQDFSPLHNIRPDTAPTIVFFGSKDAFVPVATAEKFRDEMKKVGCRCELFIYEGMGHGFFNHGNDYSKPGGGNQNYVKTVGEMDKFLESLDYLKPGHWGQTNDSRKVIK